jgi:hypothetical protein
MPRFVRQLLMGLAFIAGVFGLMQLVPYGRAHTNPPVIQEPAWDSPATRELAVRACFDCHSNQTTWPWYSRVAPFSWVVQRHVNVGRSVLNFSEWNRTWDLAEQSSSQVLRREMPPRSYRVLHDHAQLTFEERVQLARGLSQTLGLPWRE